MPLLRRAGAMDVVELDRDLIPLLEADCKIQGLPLIYLFYELVAQLVESQRAVGSTPKQ